MALHLASLSQTSQPPELWKHHRRPTLSIGELVRPLTCPVVTLINCAGAQLSRFRSRANHCQGFYHDACPSLNPTAAAGNPGQPWSGSRGSVLGQPSKATRRRVALPGQQDRRGQTSDPSDSSNLLGLP